jgi:hypothetical protein
MAVRFQPYAPAAIYRPQEDSFYRLSRPQGHSVAGTSRWTEKIHFIGTRTRDLPACSIVSQQNTLAHAPASYSSPVFKYWPSSSAKVKNDGAILPLPHASSWLVRQLLKYRCNFTFWPRKWKPLNIRCVGGKGELSCAHQNHECGRIRSP